MDNLTDKNHAKQYTDLIKSEEQRYTELQPPPDTRPQDRAFLAWYRGLIAEIGKQVRGIGIADLKTLDSLFKGAYIPFSLRYGVTPKLIDFCAFSGIEYSSLINSIESNNNPLYKNVIDSWLLLCKEYLLQNLTDESGSNINNIFVLKAVYGLSDTPNKDNSTNNRPKIEKSRSAIIAELGGNVENPGSDPAVQDIVE